MKKQEFISWCIEAALKIGVVALILVISFLIFKPFIVLIAWGAILGMAFYPLEKKLSKLLNGKNTLAATVITLIMLIMLIAPSIVFVNKLVTHATDIAVGLQDGTITIPPPKESIKEWPVIGKTIYNTWEMSTNNLEQTVTHFQEEISTAIKWLIGAIQGLMSSVLIFFFSLIIAGAFIAKADEIYRFAVAFAEKFVGKDGKKLIDNSVGTVQSVAKGVIGVAFIQALLVGAGFWFFEIPGSSVLTLIVFILALIQLPPMIVVLPVMIYIFNAESTSTAIFFTVYELVAGASDNILKPMLLGRGLDIPMLVILIGAIGGMILMGMLGLFVGSVVLALAYQIFVYWMNDEKDETIKPE
ncbi:MAG: AI-2E family transporter [Chlorobi bacterium]|nr:AI-2E family transporter [Chlorobiota bacterium]